MKINVQRPKLIISKELKNLLAYAAPYRWSLALATILLLAESATSLTIPWLTGQVASPLLSSSPDLMASIESMLIPLLFLCAVQASCSFGIFYLTSCTSEQLVADLRGRVYDHLQSLPLAFYHRRRQGDILALLTRDVEILGWFMSGTVLNIIPCLLTFFGAMILMIRIDLLLGVLAASLVPLCFLLVKVLGRRIRLLATQLAGEHATAVAIAEDNLRMLPAIKAFTREPQAAARYHDQLRHIVDLTARQWRIRSALGPLIQFLTAVGIVLLLWLSGQKVFAGTLAPGALVSFFLYGLLLTRPMSTLATSYGQLQQARGAAIRLLEALQEPPELLGNRSREMPRVEGAVAFRGVRFAYPGREATLQNMQLDIAAGETVALTGRNGAGKSTLVHLLMRFYLPQDGQILIDGIDIATVSLASLRGQIGLVPQRSLLANGTVYDNIAYGKPQPTQAEIEAAANVARAHDFIMQLPEGYGTYIGDNGVKLSGGQQQRLSLARAVLKDPPILILDEAMAMYDPEGERELLCESWEFLRQRTVIIITHHPASLALADRVLRLEHGAVHEETSLQRR